MNDRFNSEYTKSLINSLIKLLAGIWKDCSKLLALPVAAITVPLVAAFALILESLYYPWIMVKNSVLSVWNMDCSYLNCLKVIGLPLSATTSFVFGLPLFVLEMASHALTLGKEAVSAASLGWLQGVLAGFGISPMWRNNLIMLFCFTLISTFSAYALGKNILPIYGSQNDAINIANAVLGGFIITVMNYLSVRAFPSSLDRASVYDVPDIEKHDRLFKIILSVSSFSAFSSTALAAAYSPFWLSWNSIPPLVPALVVGLTASAACATVLYLSCRRTLTDYRMSQNRWGELGLGVLTTPPAAQLLSQATPAS